MQKRFLILGLVAALTGCKNALPADPSAEANVQRRLDDIDRRLNQIDERHLADVAVDNRTGFLGPNDDGYSVIATDLGSLTWQIEKVTPSGSGTKASILIGNPLTATITELRYKSVWGPVDDTGYLIEDQKHELERTITTPLPPGQYTRVDVTFADVPPAKFGQLQISKVIAKRTLFLGRK